MPSISQEDHDKITQMHTIMKRIDIAVHGNGREGLVTKVHTVEQNQKICQDMQKVDRVPDRVTKIESFMKARKEHKVDWKFWLVQTIVVSVVALDIALRLFDK